jgi:hypothetical protein
MLHTPNQSPGGAGGALAVPCVCPCLRCQDGPGEAIRIECDLGEGQAHKKAPGTRAAGTRSLTCAGTLVTGHDMPTLALATRHGDRQGYRHLELAVWSTTIELFVLYANF